MKKLLIAVMMLLTFSLIACESAEIVDTNDFVDKAYVDSQIAEIELENAYLREIIDSMAKAMEANGQIVSYEAFMNDNQMSDELIMGANFDTNLAPSYMIDENGDYIPFNDLAIKLKAKYFGDVDIDSYSQANDLYKMIPYATMTFTFTDYDITIDEVVARLILLIEELANYTYYALSGNGIDISILYSDGQNTHTINFTIPQVILTNGIFTLNYDSIIGNEFESYIRATEVYDTIDILAVKTYYDDFVANGTYDGYVLNYVE